MGLILRAICLLVVVAQPVWAHRCEKPDVARSFLMAEASSARWGAVLGVLHFDENQRPGAVGEKGRPTVYLRGQLVGQALNEDGFDEPFQAAVTVQINCHGRYCGHPQSATRYLAFVKRDKGRHYVIADPCRNWLFENPRPKALKRLHHCYTGGYCQIEDD